MHNEMLLQLDSSPHAGAAVYARRAGFAALVILASGAIASPHAIATEVAHRQDSRAAAITGDDNGSAGPVSLRSGNGKFNRNNSTVLSPTINRGLQQVSNTNVSGKSITQVAFCKKRHRICKNSQKLWNYH
ncbi:hypothetical protein ACRYCC_18560 [Actinomadura scrupuli]